MGVKETVPVKPSTYSFIQGRVESSEVEVEGCSNPFRIVHTCGSILVWTSYIIPLRHRGSEYVGQPIHTLRFFLPLYYSTGGRGQGDLKLPSPPCLQCKTLERDSDTKISNRRTVHFAPYVSKIFQPGVPMDSEEEDPE